MSRHALRRSPIRPSFAALPLAGALLLGACSATGTRGGNPEASAQFERLKQLAGTWTTPAMEGRPASTFRYTVTAGGSAIQEELFPGEPHAMVTLYHMDGPDLVLTHYCSAGNQPRMRALPSEPDGTIPFEFDGGTNFDPARDGHMHRARIRVDGPNSAHAWWTFHQDGQPDHTAAFVLSR